MILDALVLCPVAGALALAWHWRPRQGIEPSVRLLLAVYALLGAWALWFGVLAPWDEPELVRLFKPTVLYWGLASILIAAPLLGMGEPVKLILGTYFVFTGREWRWMNRCFAAMFLALGSGNLYIGLRGSESEWTGFKYACMVNLMIIFLLRLSFVWLDTIARIVVALHARWKARAARVRSP